MRRAPVSWWFAALPGIFLLCWYLLTFPGAIGPHISDGRTMYLVTQALVDRHDVALYDPFEQQLVHGWQPPVTPGGVCATEPAVIGVGTHTGGPVFSKYGIGQSLLAIPLYLLGEHVEPLIAKAFRPETASFVTSTYNSVITAITATLLCGLSLRLGWSRKTALAVSLVFGLASPAWPYTTTFFSEPTIGLCLLGAVAAVQWSAQQVSPVAAGTAGIWLGIALLVRLDSAAYVPLFALAALLQGDSVGHVVLRQRWPRILALICGIPAFALAVVGLYNLARFGHPTSTGYGIAGDYHDLHPPHSLKALWEGIYGPLLSPGKGLLLYAPALLSLPWALRRSARSGLAPLVWLVLAIGAVGVLLHANTLVVWLGGWAWGPRFLMPLLPVLTMPLGALLEAGGRAARSSLALLSGVGFVLQLPAVLLDPGVYITFLRDSTPGHCIWHAEDLYKWHPQYTPLLGTWQRLLDPATYANQVQSLQQQLSILRGSLGNQRITLQQFVGAGRVVPSPLAWWHLLALQGVGLQYLLLPVAFLLLLAAAFLFLAVHFAE